MTTQVITPNHTAPLTLALTTPIAAHGNPECRELTFNMIHASAFMTHGNPWRTVTEGRGDAQRTYVQVDYESMMGLAAAATRVDKIILGTMNARDLPALEGTLARLLFNVPNE